jgi:hypothetical protein
VKPTTTTTTSKWEDQSWSETPIKTTTTTTSKWEDQSWSETPIKPTTTTTSQWNDHSWSEVRFMYWSGESCLSLCFSLAKSLPALHSCQRVALMLTNSRLPSHPRPPPPRRPPLLLSGLTTHGVKPLWLPLPRRPPLPPSGRVRIIPAFADLS